MSTPELSVVVTVVEAGPALERCLEALANQQDPPKMEVIVPFDDTVSHVGQLASRFPDFQFLDVGRIEAAGDSDNAYWEHVRYDCRRSRGLVEAKAPLLAMVEDRGWPRENWARTMVRLHAEHPHAVIGGAIENGAESALGKAVFVCDFGRYEPPVSVDNPDFLSDINICYKREAFEGVRELWEERYQEAKVNWALRDKGAGLLLSAEARVVQQRDALELKSMLLERLHWGRTYGRVRVAEGARWKGLVWGAALPILPPMLYARHVRSQREKGHAVGELAGMSPALLLLLNAWSVGECLGYVEAALTGAKE